MKRTDVASGMDFSQGTCNLTGRGGWGLQWQSIARLIGKRGACDAAEAWHLLVHCV